MTRVERETSRLLEMIRSAGVPIPEGARFRQTYASRSMRAEGGAVWVLETADGWELPEHVCSQWPRRELLRTGVVASWLQADRCWWIDPAAPLQNS